MGLTSLRMEIANAGNPRVTKPIGFLIGSGAIFSIVLRAILQRLGVNPVSEQTFRLAPGQSIQRQLGVALFKYQYRSGGATVIFSEVDDSTLLGAHTLEALGYALDPIRRVLIPLPMMLA